MASSNASEDDFVPIDPAEPLKGIVVCCTSIPPEQRSTLAQKIAELGGVHKYDLTPDVTHLVVGDYNTPKYRHVARERSDILAMDAAWIEALSEIWKKDDEINFRKLEKEYQLKPLEKRGILPASQGELAKRDSLLVCLTGFGDQREDIAQKITSNGGRYTGDLTRKCTHLIVNKPEGKKFAAAISWGIYAVALAWLDQTIARGMILEENKFDPTLPPEQQGQGAWVKKDHTRASFGKRSRSMALSKAEEGPRKLRKTASMKLNTQRDNIWGDILGRSTSREYSFAQEQHVHKNPEPQAPIPEKQGVFANCYFFIHGFGEDRTSILEQTIFTLNGSICGSLEQAASGSVSKEPAHRFLIVPQTSQPDTHPEVRSNNLHIITEYYIEKCLHKKQFFDPSDQVLGRPFPLFPIAGFSDLTICTSGFTGIELSQVARSVAQLGAKFSEEFHTSTSVLLCRSLKTLRKDKLRMALKCGIPVVPADWLWECISTGFNVPLKDFIFPELKNQYQRKEPRAAPETQRKPTNPSQPTRSESHTNTSKPAPKPPLRSGVDRTAFEDTSPKKSRQMKESTRQDSTVSADFATARENLGESFSPEVDAPLKEVRPAKLNKSPSPTRLAAILSRSKSDPTHQMMAPKEPQPQPTAQPPPASLPHPLADADLHHRQPQQQRTAADGAKQPPQSETRRKVAAAEEAKKQAKAAERQALTSKLTSLIDSTTDIPISNLAHPAPRARRRQIFGRAVSNASNASSATSADYVATKTVPEDGYFAGFDEEPEKEVAPPATQLEYLDPEAQEVKAALMNRMMGGSGEVKPVSSSKAVGVVGGGRSLRKR